MNQALPTGARVARLARTPTDPSGIEEDSLDPDDWEAFRALCHGMLDEALDHVRDVGAGPVWRPMPEHVKRALDEPLPVEPQGPAKVCDDFRRLVLPFAMGNTHPRFFGWVHGSGTPSGMLAELLAGAMNANLGGRDHGPVYVERQVIEWSRRLFGFPEGASGLLVSGTSMATLIGLTVARNHLAGTDVRRLGFNLGDSPLIAYASAEAHNSVAKALEILGLGRDRLRAVPVDADYRMDLDALSRTIAKDREAGLQPFCVIGTAGTVNTGAIDDLASIAGVCAREGLWFHVDGAFGAAVMLSETLAERLQGIERADSLAFDFHKWLHVPYDAGCILVRRETLHRAAFSSRQDYLATAEGGLAGGNPWFCEYGPELSRGFRALKVWFTLKVHGTRRLGEKIDDNCRQARYLAGRVTEHPDLELMAPVALNIVCFRYRQPCLTFEALDRINGEIVIALQERGIAVPSTTRLDGMLAIRVNITNHRSRLADFDALLEAVVSLGASHADEAARGGSRSLAVSDFRLAKIAAIDQNLPARDRAMIEAVCRRPELRLLSGEVTIALDSELQLPFKAVRGCKVVLSPVALANDSVLALHLRHALELALLQRLTPSEWTGAGPIVLALFACRTAALYAHLMIDAEREACQAHQPGWLREAFDLATAARPWTTPPRHLAVVVAALLRLQGNDTSASEVARQLENTRAWLPKLLENAGDLAAPAEHLLTSGGDARLKLDPKTGLNAYGCSPRPRPWAITFASSTASSISDLAYQEVERLRQGLISAALIGDLDATYSSEVEKVKQALLAYCGAGDLRGAEVVLSTSGTDAELYTLHFALTAPAERLVNIVIAPDETGGGMVHAAWGRHFAATTAFGVTVEPGSPLEHFTQDRVRVETVAARGADGVLKPIAEIDCEVERLVEAAISQGERCLVHLLDASKTGWGAPSLDLLRRLPDSLDVVVDACQMRTEPESLRAYLEAGFMVQVTGSKFFTGPPFSGALVLPAAIAARARHLDPLPTSFADYAARAEWPRGWDRLCQGLPDRRNLGLLGRWTAALWEMHAFQAVPRDEQVRILAEFGDFVQDAMAASDAVEACVVPAFDRDDRSVAGGWDRLTTIFPFIVLRRTDDGEPVALSYDEARKVYQWLNRDIAGLLPNEASEDARRVAAKRCHIGQPVKLRRSDETCVGALRLCAGARIVSGVTFDRALGASPAERLRQETDDALLVLDKVALIVEHWETLEEGGEAPSWKGPAYQV